MIVKDDMVCFGSYMAEDKIFWRTEPPLVNRLEIHVYTDVKFSLWSDMMMALNLSGVVMTQNQTEALHIQRTYQTPPVYLTLQNKPSFTQLLFY